MGSTKAQAIDSLDFRTTNLPVIYDEMGAGNYGVSYNNTLGANDCFYKKIRPSKSTISALALPVGVSGPVSIRAGIVSYQNGCAVSDTAFDAGWLAYVDIATSSASGTVYTSFKFSEPLTVLPNVDIWAKVCFNGAPFSAGVPFKVGEHIDYLPANKEIIYNQLYNSCSIQFHRSWWFQTFEYIPECIDFEYNEWSECSATTSTQLRTVASSSPAGCVGGNPIIDQSCFYNAGFDAIDLAPTLNNSIFPTVLFFAGIVIISIFPLAFILAAIFGFVSLINKTIKKIIK